MPGRSRRQPIADGQTIRLEAGRQLWDASWHSQPEPPDGKNHGSSGVCLTPAGEMVLVSADGVAWGLPGGRPEGDESLEETLRREVAEEACARVTGARLLGFAKSICVAGRERGLVLVRSMWRAEAELDPWQPQYETTHRRVVTPAELQRSLPTGLRDPVTRRVLFEAGVL